MQLVSACLCGINCKYNGNNNLHPCFKELLEKGMVLPLCPETLGGLPIPRIACEITGGTGEDVVEGQARVKNKAGQDLTACFLLGAQKTLDIARVAGIETAILKSRSPSCGVGTIYDGSFSSRLRKGSGVTAALLKKYGFKVISDQDYLQEP